MNNNYLLSGDDMEQISLIGLPEDVKIKLLSALNHGSDGTYVIDSDGNRVRDKYINEEVRVSNMLIFPGSTIILDNNPLSVASYLEEYKHDL
jgi:hypothetical protein